MSTIKSISNLERRQNDEPVKMSTKRQGAGKEDISQRLDTYSEQSTNVCFLVCYNEKHFSNIFTAHVLKFNQKSTLNIH